MLSNYFINNKNINLLNDIKYGTQDLAKILIESEKDILRKHDLIPKELYYIGKKKEKKYFKNNSLFLFKCIP